MSYWKRGVLIAIMFPGQTVGFLQTPFETKQLILHSLVFARSAWMPGVVFVGCCRSRPVCFSTLAGGARVSGCGSCWLAGTFAGAL